MFHFQFVPELIIRRVVFPSEKNKKVTEKNIMVAKRKYFKKQKFQILNTETGLFLFELLKKKNVILF